MDAVALRRNKTDKKADGRPLVSLPSKTVLVRDGELTEEERICYGIFHEMARDIVAKFKIILLIFSHSDFTLYNQISLCWQAGLATLVTFFFNQT